MDNTNVTSQVVNKTGEVAKTSTQTAYMIYKVGGNVVDRNVPQMMKVGKAVYKTSNTLYRIVNPKQSLKILQNGGVILKRENALKNAIFNSGIAKDLRRLNQSRKAIINGAKNLKKKTVYGMKIVKGVASGKYKITKGSIKTLSKNSGKAVLKSAKFSYLVSKKTLQTIKPIGKQLLKKAGKIGAKGILSVNDNVIKTLNNSEDMSLKALGNSLNTMQYSAKGVKTGVQGIKTATKMTIKTSKVISNATTSAIKTAKKVAKKTSKQATKTTAKVTSKATKSATKTTAKAVLKTGKLIANAVTSKVGVLVATGVVLIVVICGAAGSIISFTTSIFGKIAENPTGFIYEVAKDTTDKVVKSITGDEEVEEPDTIEITSDEEYYKMIDDYIDKKVNARYSVIVDNILKRCEEDLKKNGGIYDKTRLYCDGKEINVTKEDIEKNILSKEEINEYINYMFSAMIVCEPDNAPNLYTRIENALITTTSKEVKNLEWCRTADNNNVIKAKEDCPNHSTVKHKEKSNENCCYDYYVCKGHKDKKGKTWYHNSQGKKTKKAGGKMKNTHYSCNNYTKEFGCNGWEKCNGHRVLEINIINADKETLYDNLVGNELEELQNKKEQLNPEEQEKLDVLMKEKTYISILKSFDPSNFKKIGFANDDNK